MNPEQRRAHLVLINQPLLDAWEARAKLCNEGDKCWDEGYKHFDEGSELRIKGTELWNNGTKLWRSAVLAAYGSIEMTWENNYASCTLANGERYGYEGHE